MPSVNHMRILILCYEFPPIGGGGGKVALDICRGLVARGHEVHVITGHVRGLRWFECIDGIAVQRVSSYRARADRCTMFEMGLFVAAALGPAIRYARTARPDIIHAHFAVPTGVVAWFIHRLTGIPYVVTCHFGDVPGAMAETATAFRLIKPATRPIWRKAATITAVSDHVARMATVAYGLPVKTILNGVDVRGCQASPPEPATPPRLLFAGRVCQQKNVVFLIRALARVADLPWHTELLGDGPDMDAVRAAILANELQQRITVRGWTSSSTVDRVLSSSDVLLLPSRGEGLSVVGVHALGHGVAIIASDIDGMRAIVEPGVNGLICPVDDIAAFEAALRTLLSDRRTLAAMKAASRRLAARVDLPRIVGQYEDLLASIASRGMTGSASRGRTGGPSTSSSVDGPER